MKTIPNTNLPYILSCESTVDVTKKHLQERNIAYVRFHYYLNGVHYYDDFGESMCYQQFYQAMYDGADTKTSQVNDYEFEAYFEEFLKLGYDILHISLSSGISGVINSASIAAIHLKEKYPNRSIYLVDSLAASSGYGLLMDELADQRDQGMKLEELRIWAEKRTLQIQHLFFSTDLTFYIKGGRVSKTAGLISGVLGICPMLYVDGKGKLVPKQTIRTKKKAMKTMVMTMEEHAQDARDYQGRCYISHSACYEDALSLAGMIEEHFPMIMGQVKIFDVGTTIGAHTGAGTVALFFIGEERV